MRFPEFKDEWEETNINSCTCRLTNGFTYDTNCNDGVAISRIETIHDKSIDYERVGHYSGDLSKIAPYKMETGDILFSHINSLTHMGKTALYKGEYDLYHGMNLLLLRVKEGIDYSFFYYLLNTPRIQGRFQVIAKPAVNQASISTSDLKKETINICTLTEQIKIGRLLSKIDERIATQNKIIEKLQSLIRGITHSSIKEGLKNGSWSFVQLSTILSERKELNVQLYPVYSVSVSEGVINQMDYLGRSFAAKDTRHYHVAHYGDIIYTKSPTGAFPYGIVKRSHILSPVAISPLYAVYKPQTDEAAVLLHYYFLNPTKTNNYLHPLIQKGAKNTINISNKQFIAGKIPFPKKRETLCRISHLLTMIQRKLDLETQCLTSLYNQKSYLLSQMFI